ncbi:MAG: VanZ family protein [Lachnospiraceae bacterium]
MFKTFLRALLKPLSFFPAIFMMWLIYTLSGQDGATSAGLSLRVSTKIVELAARLFDVSLTNPEIAQYADLIHFLIRKCAHVTLYFLLAVSVSLPLYVYRIRGIWLMLAAGVFCVAFACTDEYHQSLVAGRGPSSRDVMIDSIGIFFGIIFVRITGFLGRMTIFRPLSKSRK